MKRREMLGATAAGVAALGSSGCAVTPSASAGGSPPRDALERLRPTIERLDRSLWFLEHPESLPTVFREFPAVRDNPDASALARHAMKSLLMLGFFRDASDSERWAPEVQDRMWRAVPSFEESTRGMAAYLANLPRDAKARVQERLNAEPELPGRICMALENALDNEWVDDPLSRMRHVQLRTLVAEIAFRLKHQPVSLVVDEVVGRFQRAGGFAERDAETEDILRAAAGGQVIDAGRSGGRCKDDGGCGRGSSCVNGRCRENLISRPVLVGLVVCGLGVVIGGIGIAIAASGNFGGVFVVTLGALLLLIGLVILAIAGIAALLP